MSDWFKPAGSSGNDDFDVAIMPGDGHWRHTGLLVTDLEPAQSRSLSTGGNECIVIPLRGSATVVVGGQSFTLGGRDNVFAGPTDTLYVPRDEQIELTSPDGGRYAFALAVAKRRFPVTYVAAQEVPVELRGSGRASRQVHNFGTPATVAADSIIACEVVTPAGNWSSYPPHKHDTEQPGVEAELEEIYYFEMRTEPGHDVGAGCPDPVGYQRVYGTAERPIDIAEEVHSRDVVLVPHGWHGPSMAPPGYDMYYLNVMAGPGEERVWLICDDPAHAWVRGTWEGELMDERLPIHER